MSSRYGDDKRKTQLGVFLCVLLLQPVAWGSCTINGKRVITTTDACDRRQVPSEQVEPQRERLIIAPSTTTPATPIEPPAPPEPETLPEPEEVSGFTDSQTKYNGEDYPAIIDVRSGKAYIKLENGYVDARTGRFFLTIDSIRAFEANPAAAAE